ncbi:MAG: sodium-dependent transporter [Firmicutes bacterium]|nr:sodium-dependent transporter [Bacillota bacterium]
MGKEEKTANRGQWASTQGFIWAAAGSAVGLGTIWKFPGKAYEGGGGAYCLVYILVILLLGAIAMLGEFAVGRHSQRNCVAAFHQLKKGWGWVGLLGVLSSLIVMFYYIEVGGWVIRYILAYIMEPSRVFADPNAYFADLVGGDGAFPWDGAVLYPLIFTVATALILSGGISGGIEKFNKLVMPLLLVVMAVLVFATLALPGAMDGIRFLIKVDWSTINFGTILSALGQCFFSLSLGMSVMVTYGSYLSRQENLVQNVWVICLIDTVVAFLSGFIIIPAVFATPNTAMGGGGSFTFTALSGVFSLMPGGIYVGLLFYLLLLFAALTSSVSLVEAIVSYLTEEWGLGRRTAIWSMSTLIFFVGMAYTVSYSGENAGTPLYLLWFDRRGFYPVTAAAFIELLADRLMIPLAALASCLFVGWVWGTDQARLEIEQNGHFPFRWGKLWAFLIRYLAPTAIGMILLCGLWFGFSLS